MDFLNMQFNKSTLDKYLRIAREYISRYISPLLSATKAIHPVVRNRMMNIAYAGIVALAFVLSLIKNNDVSASVSPKDKLDYLIKRHQSIRNHLLRTFAH